MRLEIPSDQQGIFHQHAVEIQHIFSARGVNQGKTVGLGLVDTVNRADKGKRGQGRTKIGPKEGFINLRVDSKAVTGTSERTAKPLYVSSILTRASKSFA